MNRHRYASWGIGHMSHPDDPTECCIQREDHPVHQCKWCTLPYDHDGACDR